MRVFIDGSAGTTGLRIRERLSSLPGVELAILPEALRKDPSARKDAMDSSDAVFLCLPDAAAIEAAPMCSNPATVIIDTSTAHRTNPEWTYGFPELPGMRCKIAKSKRIANPGCHASGFVALIAPLVHSGIVGRDAELCAFSLTGYSGGGKKMIAQYEEERETDLLKGGRQYALGQSHKHLPEMCMACGLERPPVFSPIVVDHYSGMEVTVQLHSRDLASGAGLCDIKCAYAAAYAPESGGVIRYREDISEDGFVSSAVLSGSDAMEVSAFGNGDRIVLVSVFDNLGKGASGAAIQNMNIAMGLEEYTGLSGVVKA